MATIKENKEKAATRGDEDIQVQDDTIPSVVQKSIVQVGRGRGYLAWWTLVFQVIEVPRNKSPARLLLPRFQSSLL